MSDKYMKKYRRIEAIVRTQLNEDDQMAFIEFAEWHRNTWLTVGITLGLLPGVALSGVWYLLFTR